MDFFKIIISSTDSLEKMNGHTIKALVNVPLGSQD